METCEGMELREHRDLILDGTKICVYQDRVKRWLDGDRVAPITVDMALTRACTFKCVYCYGQLQHNSGGIITKKVITDTFDDFVDIGVKGVSLVSDGESTCSPHLEHAILYGHSIGLAMALGTNGALLTDDTILAILPRLSYLRFNISAGEKTRYNQIMRPPHPATWDNVLHNIKYAILIKTEFNLPVTIGLQMVLMPEFADQIMPLAKLALDLEVDYLVIKHCSDDENGALGVDYKKYQDLKSTLEAAEKLSTPKTRIVVKWSKINEGKDRPYKQCYGPPFLIQISGSGLVAPCGMLFGKKYREYHIGNITERRFKDIFKSKIYWEVMDRIASEKFDATRMCGSLCLQHSVNKYLDAVKKGAEIKPWEGQMPIHKEFV